jgi:hypothetical protein
MDDVMIAKSVLFVKAFLFFVSRVIPSYLDHLTRFTSHGFHLALHHG